MDMDAAGNVVMGGTSKDNKLISGGQYPIIAYIKQGMASKYTWSI